MDLLFERAQQLVQLQRYKEAEKELRLLLAQDPEHSDALALFSICQAEQGQLPEAIKTIQNALSKSPDNDYFLYLHSLYLVRSSKLKEGEQMLLNAVAINPRSPDYFGLLAVIKLNQKEFEKALDYANQGLAIDPDNIQCLNMRSNALFKLDKKEEAYATIQEALNQDPENEQTHTNLGWGLLEKGDHKQALAHFREALKINPNYEYAKAGLIEGLKARYLFYRLFLRYAFFIGNLKEKFQWVFLIGLWAGIRLIDWAAETNPEYSFILKPIVYTYMAFALSSWIIVPLSNLFLRLNVYGRFALSKDEIRASNYVGIAFVVGVSSLLYYLFSNAAVFLVAGVIGVSMMIPLSSMLRPTKPSSRRILIGYTILLLIIGCLEIFVSSVIKEASILFVVYAFGVILYGWVANFVMMRT